MPTAKIAVSGSGTTEVIPAKAGAKIKVLRLSIFCATAQTVTWKSGTTAITGDMAVGANGGESSTCVKDCLFETSAGEALNITTTGAAGGHLEYEHDFT